MEGGLLVLFLGLGVSIAPQVPTPKNFLPTPFYLTYYLFNKQEIHPIN